jgi:hypothetical protein
MSCTKGFMTLADYLARENMTDLAFAEQVKCDRSTIYRIRKHGHRPSPELMETIAVATGGEVRPDDDFDGLPKADAA